MPGYYVLPKQVNVVRFSYRPEERLIRWRGLDVFFFKGPSCHSSVYLLLPEIGFGWLHSCAPLIAGQQGLVNIIVYYQELAKIRFCFSFSQTYRQAVEHSARWRTTCRDMNARFAGPKLRENNLPSYFSLPDCAPRTLNFPVSPHRT